MKAHDSLLAQEPPPSPAGVPCREGQEASDTVPTLMLVLRIATPHRPEEVKGAPAVCLECTAWFIRFRPPAGISAPRAGQAVIA